MVNPPESRISTLIQLGQNYDHLCDYWVTKTGIQRVDGWVLKFFRLLDYFGIRTCSAVFKEAVSTLLKDVNASNVKELKREFVSLEPTQLKHVQNVFQRCVWEKIGDPEICFEINKMIRIQKTRFSKLREKVKKLDEGSVTLADGNVWEYIQKYYEEGGEQQYSFEKMQASFSKDKHRQNWYRGDSQEKIHPDDVDKTFERWKDRFSLDFYDKIQLFCHQAIPGPMVLGGFIDQSIREKTMSGRLNKARTPDLFVQVTEKQTRVFEDGSRLMYMCRCGLTSTEDEKVKVSCQVSVEWDIKNDRLIFRPGYNFKVHNGCTLEELEKLSPIIFGK